MKVEIRLWQTVRRIVRISEEGWYILSVIKNTDEAARIELRCELPLDITEAKAIARALELAAKVASYLDKLMPSDAYDMIAGLPTTPYDGWRPMPRAGRTENP